MKVKFEYPANPCERFAPDAFDSVIGQPFTINDPRGLFPGKVRAAEVVRNGVAVVLTVETDEDIPELVAAQPLGMSVADREAAL